MLLYHLLNWDRTIYLYSIIYPGDISLCSLDGTNISQACLGLGCQTSRLGGHTLAKQYPGPLTSSSKIALSILGFCKSDEYDSKLSYYFFLVYNTQSLLNRCIFLPKHQTYYTSNTSLSIHGIYLYIFDLSRSTSRIKSTKCGWEHIRGIWTGTSKICLWI